jgi:hypothetical protein
MSVQLFDVPANEAAKFFSRSTLHRLRVSGQLPFHRDIQTGRVRYSSRDLKRLIARRNHLCERCGSSLNIG